MPLTTMGPVTAADQIALFASAARSEGKRSMANSKTRSPKTMALYFSKSAFVKLPHSVASATVTVKPRLTANVSSLSSKKGPLGEGGSGYRGGRRADRPIAGTRNRSLSRGLASHWQALG